MAKAKPDASQAPDPSADPAIAAAAAAAAPAASSIPPPAPAAESPDDNVRIYNRSRRQFAHSIYPKTLADGTKTPQVDYVSGPANFVTVPRFIAQLWLAGYPDDFVQGSDALKTIDASAAEAIQLREANANLVAEKDALAGELEAAKAQLAKLQGGN